MRSSLANLLPTARNEEELHEMKRRAWQDHNILVVKADAETLNWVQKEQIKQIGEALYGKS